MMAGMELSPRSVREQIASAIQLIVHQSRLKDGTRRITHVTEVAGMESDVITLQDLFVFDFSAGIDDEGRVRGRLKSTGLRPKFLDKLAERGVYIDAETFALEPKGAVDGRRSSPPVSGRALRPADRGRPGRRRRVRCSAGCCSAPRSARRRTARWRRAWPRSPGPKRSPSAASGEPATAGSPTGVVVRAPVRRRAWLQRARRRGARGRRREHPLGRVRRAVRRGGPGAASCWARRSCGNPHPGAR